MGSVHQRCPNKHLHPYLSGADFQDIEHVANGVDDVLLADKILKEGSVGTPPAKRLTRM